MRSRIGLLALAVLFILPGSSRAQQAVPLPEHPRPDFERAEWLNLNGSWAFRLDPADEGRTAGWQRLGPPGAGSIVVPFSWASPASGVGDTATIGWYARDIDVPASWNGRRIFVVVGASDWRTTAWLDGRELGTHEGGYTPFAFELAASATGGVARTTPTGRHRLVFRVDDAPRPFKLEGKQGYGNARGLSSTRRTRRWWLVTLPAPAAPAVSSKAKGV